MADAWTALAAIGRMADGEIDIADAALQLARIDRPEADWRAARAHLSDLAREAVAAAAGLEDEDLPARARVLADLLAGRHGYAGDAETYDDLANANLIGVIERRRGLPVALGILWMHAAHAAGWEAHGIDFPAHFLIGLGGRGRRLALDVFGGGEPIGAAQLRGLIRRIEGADAALRPDLFRPMTRRAVLLRLQNNIRLRRLQAGQIAEALRCGESMLAIAPEEPLLWRDAAALNERLERYAAALQCYERLAALLPEGEAAREVRAAMAAVRARLQ